MVVSSTNRLIFFLLLIACETAWANSEQITHLLTEEENEWIREHPVVSFTGDPNWLPYEAFDEENHYIGIVSEHLEIISKLTGLRFDIIPSKTWTESTEKAKKGEVDILSETDDSDLKSHLNFTQPYISNPIVIAMHSDEHYVDGILAIDKKRIGLVKDYGYASKIRRKYTEIQFSTVDNIQSGLIAVSTGEIDALLCTLALCSYTISELNLNNVRITGRTEFDTKLAFGVQKDMPVLLAILNKAIGQITKEQQQQILDRWIKEKFTDRVDYSLVYKTVAISIILFAFIWIWNRRLAREIQLRRASEKERDQVEKVLRSQAKIIDQIHDSVIAVDLEGFITSWNKGSERTFGYLKEEMLGKHISLVYPKESHDHLQNDLIPTLKNKGAYEEELKLLKKSGEVFYAHLSLSMLYDEDNAPMGMIGYTMDIDERKKGEEEILRLASIVKYSSDFIGISDIEGKALFLNEAGRKLTGVNNDELFFSTTVPDYFPQQEREFIMREVIPTVLEQGRWTGESLFENFETGEIIPVWFDLFRIDDPLTGEPLNFATVSRDIRERKAYEEELKRHREGLEDLVEERTRDLELAKQEAEKASLAKSEFLSRMSHELRTPLNAIIGFSQLLELDIEDFEEKHQSSLQEILSAGKHLLDLINELLDLAAIESGKLDVPLEHICFNTTFRECVGLMQAEADKKGIEFIDRIKTKDVYLHANSVRLKQILLNLLSNSIKYNKEKGKVFFDTEIKNGKRFRISITDTGNGLSDEEQQSMLFVPFERFNKNNTVQGTGIGLVITQYLVEKMDGTIGVESEKGKGSTFWVELPLSDEHQVEYKK